MKATNPFGRPLPVVVMLRDKSVARVEQIVEDVPGFPLLGHMRWNRTEPGHVVGEHAEKAPDNQLWRRDGRWLESGAAHALDIIGVLDGAVRVAEGTDLLFEPFAAAAGAKGGAA